MPKNCRSLPEPSREGAYTYIDGKIVYMEDMIMEQRLGRKLRPNERVFHKNGSVFDNRDENLALVIITDS